MGEMAATASSDALPLNRRVVDPLRQEIGAGVLAVGERLPTEEALCQRFGISRHTVRDALRKLPQVHAVWRAGVVFRGICPYHRPPGASVERCCRTNPMD